MRKLTAILLLALWLPATAHCSLDALADWFGDFCEANCPHDPAAVHHADACAAVEGGDYTAAPALAHAPPPQLALLACLSRLHARLLAAAAPLAPPAWSGGHPDNWRPAWAFARRAAPPARAPSPA